MTAEAPQRPLGYEANGINVIGEDERKGVPRSLFWPWFAANISVLGLGYGAYVLEGGVSFWQAVLAGLIGIIVSFLLVGFIAVAGKRGSAPTLVLSRAAFGVQGNKLPSLVSWVLNVGWEIILVVLATLATATVFHQLGWSSGDATKVIAFLVITALVVGSAALGFDTIMRLQAIITVITGVLDRRLLHPGRGQDPLGDGLRAALRVVPGLPRRDRAGRHRLRPGLGEHRGRLLALPAAPVLRRRGGVLDHVRVVDRAGVPARVRACCSRDPRRTLLQAINADPIGALSTILPTWYLVPFVIVAVLGLVGGAVLDIYSSGLTMLAAGVRIPRWSAALIDGALMIAGAIYMVFFSTNFFGPFEGFLITLGVPISAWCGVMLADILLRRRAYADAELFSSAGRYGAVRWAPVALLVIGTAVGWGLVTNSFASWLSWQGYLLRAGWPGRQDRGLGVREPGRRRRPGHRVRRLGAARPRDGPPPGSRRRRTG